ncbi:hypothetical protein DPMN_104866 [Dreissena polymorpha]|uniref:Uncharacterized protein n=1 Tax=Dreissena polymorpha TaxID=45954 RepID=A0A9D4HDV3_DREPO|nr:hypothetical protein DPMN_104866 [Dreissena polymorpha]
MFLVNPAYNSACFCVSEGEILIGNLRRVRKKFGNVSRFRILPFRWLGGALFASFKRRADRQVGSSPVNARGSTSEEKGRNSKRTVL